MPDRLYQLAADVAARAPQALIGWRAGQAVGQAQFMARLHAWRALLQSHSGTRFALYLDDSIEFGAALLGAWQAGKTIWLSADTLDASCAALGGAVDGFLGEFPAALNPLSPPAAAADGFPAAALAAIAPDFPALVVFTSGSTGAAQAIPKKLSQIASELATLEQLFGAAADGAAVLATVSHQHIYGLLFKVLWPLCAGRAIHALSLAFHEQLAPALAAGPCVLVASPAHLKRLPEHLDWQGAARNLRAVFSSGGPLAPETAYATGQLLGQVPIEVYGSSETGGIAWRQRKAGSGEAWTVFPSVAWRVTQQGALEVCSAHLADANWLTLADRASAHGAQQFLLLGRSDRIVKIEEKRISLDAIEAGLRASGLAAEARVLLCDPVAGERQKLAAFVIPSAAGKALLDGQGKQALNSALRGALNGVVEPVALPRRWRYLDQLPVNAQGKTTQAALLALLGEVAVAPRMPLVTLLEQTPQRVLLELSAPANLYYFDGHFDAAPILPGVVQVEWALNLGRSHFALPARFRAINALKFQHVIRPDMLVQLELQHDTVKHCLQFRYLSASGAHASGRILFHADDIHV